MLLRQLANTVKALHDAHAAAGDARRAGEIRDVVMTGLQSVHDALPAAPEVAGVAAPAAAPASTHDATATDIQAARS